MKLKVRLLLSAFLICGLLSAQNVFLDRAYWKKNPTLEQVKAAIKSGNDATELNSNAFDAISWGLIEKVDNDVIKYLLTLEGNGVNKRTHDGRTYIFWAAYKDNLPMMKYLVGKGAKTDVIDSHGYSVLNFAAVTGQQNMKLYDYLITNGADPKTEKNNDGANALLLVAPFLENDILIEYFITKGIALNSTDNNGNGIFNYAAKGGNIPMLKKLIKKGVAYKTTNANGGNAMLMAAQGTRGKKNTLEVYEFLRSVGIKTNVTTKGGHNPLHSIASYADDTNLYDFFLDSDLGINAKDDRGRTILAIALQRNKPEVSKFLIAKGADVDVQDADRNTLGYYLVNSFREKSVAAFDEKMKLLTAKKVDFTQKQNGGNTLLHLAVQNNNLPLLAKLKDVGIDINAQNKEGYTALHLAAMKADSDAILKHLLKQGANTKIKTEFDESVFDLASENELLQKHNVSINFLK